MTVRNEDKTIKRPVWLPEDTWPFRIQSQQVGDDLVAYTDEGEGPTLLLVHDGMWSYPWGQLIAELRNDFRLVTLDFPGSGLSPVGDGVTSLEGDSRLLEEFVDTIGLEGYTPVLHDLGGAVGLGLAARRPEQVDGLVLVNTFAWPPHVASLKAMFWVMTSPPVRGFNVATNLIPRMTSGKFGLGRNLDEAGRSAFLGGFGRRASRKRFHDLMDAARSETAYLLDVEGALGSVLADKPVLTIFGEKNDPFGFQEKFRDYFHHVVEMVIPDGNHFPMADDPMGVANRIRAWHRSKIAA